MVPQVQVPDAETLDSLKRAAVARAEQLGHRLQAFRTAKHDPLCSVAFCSACRQMVLVSAAERGSLFGYALETPCPGRRTD